MAANSISVLLSYIDNLLWLCTQLFYGIVFVVEFNFKLFLSIFRGCVQLWGMSIQAVIDVGNAFVFSIEFLAELPVRTFHLGKYLLQIFKNQMNEANRACMSWFWTTLTCCVNTLTLIIKNLGLAFVNAGTQLFDLLFFHYAQFADILSSLTNTTYHHIREAKATTVHAMHSVGTDVQESMLRFCNVVFEFFIAGVSYPIALLNTCTKGIIEGVHIFAGLVKDIGDCLVRVFEDIIQIVLSSSSSITNGLHDILNALKEIATFPIQVIDYISQTIAAVFYSAADGCSSLSLFIVKNWGALLALALCITLVWVTINMTGQHERNIQHILRDLTRLVNSFTHSRPQEVEREPMRPEGHLHNDFQPQGQQQGEDEGHEQNENNDADRELPVGEVGGGGDQPGPSSARHATHTPYSLRSRPYNPTGESSGENGSVENIMSDLKHRLSAEHERKMCVVCLDAEKNTLFLPCRHLCVCLLCADRIVSSDDILFRQCPLCRSRIGSLVEVYD